MTDTKYQPLNGCEENTKTTQLPPYELEDISNGADRNDVGLASGEEPLGSNLNILEDEGERDTLYSFKIKSSVLEDRAFRFQYSPKRGLAKFRALVEEKIRSTTQTYEDVSLAIGYFDSSNDLIMITSEEDFLECIPKERAYRPTVHLVTYRIEDHSKIMKKFKQTKRRQCAIVALVTSAALFILIWVVYVFH